MKERIEKLLRGEEENHILPFFWQHGEDEDTLRRYMRVIHEAHCGAVCVESRPHPDFCGEKWWSDLGCILDEAERLGMKVWVLDDSHFPTGYANGALKEAPPSLCRQNIVFHSFVLCGDVDADLRALGAFKAPERIMSEHEKKARGEQKQREFDDDEIVCCVARQGERLLDLLPFVQGERLRYSLPDGEWTLYTCVATRNSGYHREYIRMTSPSSCRVLIDAVYEPHYAHFLAISAIRSLVFSPTSPSSATACSMHRGIRSVRSRTCLGVRSCARRWRKDWATSGAPFCHCYGCAGRKR